MKRRVLSTETEIVKKKKKNLKKETLQMKNTTEIKFLWIGSRAEW